MQISLTQNADRLLERMMTLGYTDPADIIEVALERMMSEISDQESPELLDWFRSEVAIGADEADAGEFSTLTLDDIKAQVLAAHTSKSA
jgi:methanogenic corrinoid protein MtbC1